MSVEENSNLSIKNWLAILVLAISTFIIVTTELAPVGLLTPMAKDFGVSESQIGVTVTIYAWVGAFSAILASVFLGNIAKKTLLIVLITILLASNTLSATVTTYSMLLVARVIGALAHGSFWAIIGATAVAIVPPKHIGVATSIVFGGVSAASVFGVPLSNYIGIALGWHNAFWLMAILSAIALVGILLLIPRIQSNSAIGIASLKHVFQSATLRKIYLATLIVITAHFAAFTFIEPWLQMQQLFPSTYIPIALFTFGIAGLLGNFITGFTIDKFLKPTVSISIILMSGVCQHSCHPYLNQATETSLALTRLDRRTGLRAVGSTGEQFLTALPFQRAGFTCFAITSTDSRLARISPSLSV
nr:MFS transporter [Moraxella osloensis]